MYITITSYCQYISTIIMQPESLFIAPYESGEQKIVKSLYSHSFHIEYRFYSLQGLYVANEKNNTFAGIKIC